MRKLIMKRKKTFTASLVKVRIFIENDLGELELGTVRCREVGSLKNGATGEYDIPNESVYVFVVFSKVLPNEFHTVHQIPAGDGNVELFTGPTLNPLMGNPFDIYTRDDLNELDNKKGW
jgi:hypothetical protein